MMASDKDVTICRFNKRSRVVYFSVFGNTVTLNYTQDNELIVDRVGYVTDSMQNSLAALEDYFYRIGLKRYGVGTYRFPNFMSLSALKILHTLNSPGRVGADTYVSVSNIVDTYLSPKDLVKAPSARYVRIFNRGGRRAIDMVVDDGRVEIAVLYSDGHMPLFSVPVGVDASIVRYALYSAIATYKTECNSSTDDGWVAIGSDDYYRGTFVRLKPTNRPEFNVMCGEEASEEVGIRRESPVDVNVTDLLRSAEPIVEYLPIGICIPLAALKYDGLYFTVGSVTGYDSNSKYSMLRVQYYRKRTAERDANTPMHLAAVTNYGTVSFTAPDGVSIIDCDGMDPAEFAKLIVQYATVLRR